MVRHDVPMISISTNTPMKSHEFPVSNPTVHSPIENIPLRCHLKSLNFRIIDVPKKSQKPLDVPFFSYLFPDFATKTRHKTQGPHRHRASEAAARSSIARHQCAASPGTKYARRWGRSPKKRMVTSIYSHIDI